MDQTLYVGDVYEEKGATVPDGWVLRISGTVDTSTAGVYEITYYAFNPETGQNATRVKTVEVLEITGSPITLNGAPIIYVSLENASSYIDPGATTDRSSVLVTNFDGTSSKSFKGLPNSPGTYAVVYYLTEAPISMVTRTIHIVDTSNTGGGEGSGFIPPTKGPASITLLQTNEPKTGPTEVGILLPSGLNSGPAGITLYKMASTKGPRGIALEVLAVKPIYGYPINSITEENTQPSIGFPIESVAPSEDYDPTIPIKPTTGYAIESTESDTTYDPIIPVKPAKGYQIESVEKELTDPTIPVKPAEGYQIESVEKELTDPTIPVKPAEGYQIESVEKELSDPTVPVKPLKSYKIQSIENV